MGYFHIHFGGETKLVQFEKEQSNLGKTKRLGLAQFDSHYLLTIKVLKYTWYFVFFENIPFNIIYFLT